MLIRVDKARQHGHGATNDWEFVKMSMSRCETVSERAKWAHLLYTFPDRRGSKSRLWIRDQKNCLAVQCYNWFSCEWPFCDLQLHIKPKQTLELQSGNCLRNNVSFWAIFSTLKKTECKRQNLNTKISNCTVSLQVWSIKLECSNTQTAMVN